MIEMPSGYISDFLVMTKTYNEDFVKLYDLTEKQCKWYSQAELAAAKLLDEVMWLKEVFELYKKMFEVMSESDAKS